MWGSGIACLLSVLFLFVIHTGPVRRLALSRIQGWLRKDQGLAVEAAGVEYNLLASRFELKGVVVKGTQFPDMPAPLRAQRVVMLLPVWRLAQGSFETADIRIEGLEVQWITDASGRSNWPSIKTSGAQRKAGGPAISVTDGDVLVRDNRKGWTLHLPHGRASAAWDPKKHEYAIRYDGLAGQIAWKDAIFGLDEVRLKTALANSGFVVESLKLVSGPSRADLNGLLAGTPGKITAEGTLEVDLATAGRSLRWTVPALGRVQLALSAAGPLEAPRIEARLSGSDIVISGNRIQRAEGNFDLDANTGELRVRNASASVFAGRVSGNGRLWTGGGDQRRSEFALKMAGVDPAQVARAFGSKLSYRERASAEVQGSWPGLNWRAAELRGSAQSGAATVKFKAKGTSDAIRASIEGSLAEHTGVRGDLALNLRGQALSGQLTGDVSSLANLSRDLERLLDRPPGSFTQPAVDGAAHWSASLKGTLAHPSASAQASVTDLAIGEWKGAGVQVEAEGAVDGVDVRRAHIAWGGQELELQGHIDGLSPEASMSLEGKVEGHSLAPVFDALGIGRVAEGAVSGSVRVKGSLGRPEVETTLTLADLAVADTRFGRTTLDAGWRNGELTIRALKAEQHPDTGALGHLEGTGFLDTATGRYTLDIAGQNLQPAPGPLAGLFQAEIHGAATLGDPKLNIRLTGGDVQVAGIAVGDVTGELHASERRATAVITAPALNIRATSTARMEANWPFDVTLEASNTRLNTIPVSSFDASVQGSGFLAQPRLERLTAVIRNLHLATGVEETISDGPIELSYTNGRVEVGRLALKSGDSRLSVTGTMPVNEADRPGSLTLSGRVVLDPFASRIPGIDASKTGGVAEVNATITGTAQHWTPGGSIRIDDGRLGWATIPIAITNVTGPLKIEDGIVRAEGISGKAGTGTLRMGGSLPLAMLWSTFSAPAIDPKQPARFSAQVDGVTLSGGKGENAATATLGVRMEGEASTLSLDALQGTIDFTELGFKGRANVRQTSPARVTVAGGVARLSNLELKGTQSSLKASGSLGLKPDYPIQLDILGSADLAIFGPLVAPLEVSGLARLEAHVGGTLGEPRSSGFVTLEQASLAVPEPSLQATGVRLKATLAGDQINVDEFQGALNGGAFTAGGDFKLRHGNIVDANLSLRGKDTFLEYPAGVKTTSSLDLKLVSREDQLALTGQIEVQEGYYDASLQLFGSSEGSSPTLPAAAEQPSNPLRLDLRIVTKRPVEMDNNLGRLAARGDLRLTGTVTQPRLVGKMDLERDGRIYFGDHTYYIERGAVRFLDAPKITPELDIHAYTRSGDYTVNLGLTGELKDVTTTFTSDPPLSRDDVISVLITGKTLSENRGVDVRSMEAYALMTGAMNASLSSRLHRTLGVSRVAIQPGAVAAESNPGTRITITQDFTRTLRLMYSMNLSDSNDQIWVTEYDLTNRFTTRAVKQSDNTYRGEFRHDIRFGGPSTNETAQTGAPLPPISKVEFTGGEPFSPTELAKHFKLKAGQRASAMKVRKNSERLSKFLVKKGYLESRVFVDRVETGQDMSLMVQIELGPTVEISYRDGSLPGREKARVRKVWHAGISDRQRQITAKDAILNYYADKGYLQAQITPEILGDSSHKQVRFDLQPGTRYRGLKIELQGADNDRARDIAELLKQRQLRLSVYRGTPPASETITRYYERRGYLAAKVGAPAQELDGERRIARFVIPVDEGPVFRVGAIEFSGNVVLTSEELRRGLPLETGQVFESARLQPASTALKVKYGELGFGEANIQYEVARRDDSALVDVSFTVVENKQTSIGRVRVEGNRRTTEEFVRSQLRVEDGEIANATLIRESSTNLSQTGAYSTTDIRLQPPVEAGASDKRVQVADMVVAVTEPKPFRLLYGGLYDSGGGPGFIADFQNQNWLSAGRVLGLRTRADPETNEVRLYMTKPFWRQLRLSTTVAVYYTRETKNYQTTPTETLGASMQQDLPLRSKWLLSYGYRFEKQRGFVPDPAAPDVTAGVVSVAPATLTISRDSRDSFLDATTGSFISHGFEFAPRFLGSDYPYLRWYGQYFKYFPLTRPRPVPFGEQPKRSRLVFATGTRLGLQKGFSAEGAVLTNRFYAGGGTTVRGFGQDQLGPKLADGQPAGGNAVLVLNEELRYPLYGFLDAVTFVDVGNVFPRVSDFRFSDLRTTGGFGLRVRNPFVVLRFDYGFKFSRLPGEKLGAFFFSIGQAF
jgi:outer membrane protein assembly complex protein YaeT